MPSYLDCPKHPKGYTEHCLFPFSVIVFLITHIAQQSFPKMQVAMLPAMIVVLGKQIKNIFSTMSNV